MVNKRMGNNPTARGDFKVAALINSRGQLVLLEGHEAQFLQTSPLRIRRRSSYEAPADSKSAELRIDRHRTDVVAAALNLVEQLCNRPKKTKPRPLFNSRFLGLVVSDARTKGGQRSRPGVPAARK